MIISYSTKIGLFVQFAQLIMNAKDTNMDFSLEWLPPTVESRLMFSSYNSKLVIKNNYIYHNGVEYEISVSICLKYCFENITQFFLVKIMK